ncbi:DoxX family membrane protein [Sphingomonas turrisvirgatae]|uniref:DoxX family protein n=1 Tax=Sphingomonas turrisvirgatae TaxID=1888892 RepID=A0A1E3LTU3_9SPHN|nr:DoxX family membrane protein [Sphingomonas turrisvirgatae]ODP37159.1 hypothetical protein BFL28_02680 [Sphingomonas turrisvirgatae]
MTAGGSRWHYIVLFARLYYGIHFLVSGLNYAVMGVVPDFSKAGAVGDYMAALSEVGMYQGVKYLEIVLGAMLVLNRFVPLALIFMAAISAVIIYLNLLISPHPRQLFTGIQELILIGFLLLAYGGHYAGFCKRRSAPLWFWDGLRSNDAGAHRP